MTGEEMERAIEFLLQSQAALEARMGQVDGQIEQLGERIAETNRVVQVQADTQTQFVEVVTKALDGLAERQSRTEETLKLFIETERRIDVALVEAQKRSAEDQKRAAEDHRRIIEGLAEAQTRGAKEQRTINEALVEGQRRTDDKVERLAETVERFIREGRNGRG